MDKANNVACISNISSNSSNPLTSNENADACSNSVLNASYDHEGMIIITYISL